MLKELLGGPVKEDPRLEYEEPMGGVVCHDIERLLQYEEAVRLPVLRVDSSVHEGSDTSRFYDLMVSDMATISRSACD
ncbi:hypothetical protein KXD40_007155 [Peronospora effusa]|nr:hypothetical protein KXD40_007155 [Peronospora effusa]